MVKIAAGFRKQARPTSAEPSRAGFPTFAGDIPVEHARGKGLNKVQATGLAVVVSAAMGCVGGNAPPIPRPPMRAPSSARGTSRDCSDKDHYDAIHRMQDQAGEQPWY